MYLFHKIFFRQTGAGVNFSPERLNIFLWHGQSCRHRMSSKFRHQFTALCHLIIHGVRFNRTSGTFYPAIRSTGQDKHRFVVQFTYPPGNNARQAFMALGQIYDQHAVMNNSLLHNHPLCFFQPFQRQVFPPCIQFYQFPGQHTGPFQRRLQQ